MQVLRNSLDKYVQTIVLEAEKNSYEIKEQIVRSFGDMREALTQEVEKEEELQKRKVAIDQFVSDFWEEKERRKEQYRKRRAAQEETWRKEALQEMPC